MSIPLTKIKGVGPSTDRLFKSHGINSVEELIAAPIESISTIPNFGEVRAKQLRQAALDFLSRRQVNVNLSPSAVSTSATEITPSIATTHRAMHHQSSLVSEAGFVSGTNPAPTQQQYRANPIAAPAPEATTAPAEDFDSVTTARERIRRRRRGPQGLNGNNTAPSSPPAPAVVAEARQSTKTTVAESLPNRTYKPRMEVDLQPRNVIVTSTRELSTPTQTQINTRNMALFCDFENVILGARDARYTDFDIQKVLERLLLKGNVVVRKAYCDWERYKEFKVPMHDAAFELTEIPHVRQSGKTSADIRMVVDALELCYTKQHLDTFVIISGDSDFTSLVTKLRENNKTVIGVGVKKSTSDLFTSNCDEFIFYDDLLRESDKEMQRPRQDKSSLAIKSSSRISPSQEELKMQEALDLVLETVEDLFEERGGDEKVWGSMVKQAVKRRRPGFSERYHGFNTFSKLLEEAAERKLLVIRLDEKSGGYIIDGFGQED